MHSYVPVLVFAAATDRALIVLLCVLGGLLGIVFALFNGRHPPELAVDSYRGSHQMEDPTTAWKILGELQACLQKSDFQGAHACMLSQTNWFFMHRLYLPLEFSNVWFVLRNRVNRMMTVHGWPQDWAQRDVERMRNEALRLVEKAIAVLGDMPAIEQCEEFVPAETIDQSVRAISAPSERSLSSMRS